MCLTSELNAHTLQANWAPISESKAVFILLPLMPILFFRQDFIFLNSYATNEEKIEMLMELLRNKTEDHHNDFLEIMEEDYKWLRDKCEIFFQRVRLDALKNGGSKPCPVPQGDLIIDCQVRY